MFVGKARGLFSEESSGKVLQSVKLKPASQTSDRLERPARDKRSSLLGTFVNYASKKSYNIGPGRVKLFPS
jgi:hypothetical protein